MTAGSGRALALLSLVIAGEAIFLLPFVLTRIFRPTFLDIFQVSNLQLGIAFSLYGVVAMISYFAGGPLADRYSARKLIVAALLATSCGGLILVAVPAIGVLTLLYGFWGLTTIFLFWAALIKTTRELGADSQGKAFGFLDGGRGLFAAVLASVSVVIFAALLPAEVETASFTQRSSAFSAVILLFTAMGVLSALLVWLFVPDSQGHALQPAGRQNEFDLTSLKRVMGMPTVWLQAVIILCAYVAYKSTDDFSLYARDVFAYNEVEAARIGTLSFWMRPVAAVAAGILADRLNAPILLIGSFILVLAGSLVIATGLLHTALPWLLLLTIAATSAGINALRGLYFAVFGEAGVPLGYTGSAVGLVSFIGFTPDIFMGPLMGYLLDSSPGASGHQQVFAVVSGFALLGILAACWFRVLVRNPRDQLPGTGYGNS